jgi:hypothetical protein
MPRFFHLRGRIACSALALACAVGWALAARAEPVNPLRPALTASAMRIVPVPSDPPAIRPVAAWEDMPGSGLPNSGAQALGVPDFGQPEPLPSAAGQPNFADQFGQPDLYGAGSFHDGITGGPQVHPLFAHPWFAHEDPNDPLRHIGLGQPLIGTSWRNRPLYFGTFVGGILMDDIQSHRIYQNDTAFIGLRIGYDFDHFWGLEMRGAFARPDLAAGSGGPPIKPASRDNFADVDLLFYPFGDARWRPYLLGGLGFQTFRFNNAAGERISEAPLMIPVGCGLKYFWHPWLSLRFDFTDNICLGNARISGMNNLSLMCGCELRFGGRRPSYFPWHNNTSYW